MHPNKKAVAAIAALAATIGLTWAIAESASASIPDASGIIHGCYRTTTDELRVIDTDNSGTCYGDETAISWPSSTPSLKYFSNTMIVGGGQSRTAVCPDGGIPVAIYMQQINGNSGSYEVPAGTNRQFLVQDSNGVPDGLGVDGPTGSYPFILVCT